MTNGSTLRSALPSKKKALAIAVSTAVVGIQAAQAQQKTQGLEEIVVTATKRAENLQNVPESITAFTTQDILNRGFTGLSDYAKFIPALDFAKRQPGGTTVVFRGVAASGLEYGARPTSSVYLDEQPITAAGLNPDPRLIDIQRVEALSGPQGTLFGDASEAGTLRIITNKPDASAFNSWVQATGNNVDHGDWGYDFSGMVNLPMIKDTLALRLVGFRTREAGYIDNVLGTSPGGTFTNKADVKKNVNSQDITGGRAALRWTPDGSLTVDLSAIFQETKTHGFGDVNPGTGDLHQVRFNPESADDKWYQLGLTIEKKMDWADATLAVSYFNRKFEYNADATAYLFAFQQEHSYLQSLYPAYNISIYDFGGDPHAKARDKEHTRAWTVEARLATPKDSDSRWKGLIGFFFDHSETKSLFTSNVDNLSKTPAFSYLNYNGYYSSAYAIRYNKYSPEYRGKAQAYPLGPTNNWFFGQYDQMLQTIAMFGQASFDFTDHLTITAGGRWFYVESKFDLLQGGLMQGNKPNRATDLIVTDAHPSSSETGFVPKFTATYHIDSDKLVYFTYSRGFRAGGGNPVRRRSILPRTYKSDFLDNYEFGAKTTWLDGRLRANIAVYMMKWDNIQIQVNDPTPGLFSLAYVNFPSAKIDGVEAAVDWIPFQNWEISGNFAYNHARLATTATLFPGTKAPVTVTKGTPLPLSPDWKGTLGVTYTFPMEFYGGNPFVRFDWAYKGKSVNSLAGVESVVNGRPVTVQHPYSTGDLRLGIDTSGWTAAVFVNNLWDERGQNFYSNRWATQRLTVNQPRTFGITFRKYFK